MVNSQVLKASTIHIDAKTSSALICFEYIIFSNNQPALLLTWECDTVLNQGFGKTFPIDDMKWKLGQLGLVWLFMVFFLGPPENWAVFLPKTGGRTRTTNGATSHVLHEHRFYGPSRHMEKSRGDQNFWPTSLALVVSCCFCLNMFDGKSVLWDYNFRNTNITWWWSPVDVVMICWTCTKKNCFPKALYCSLLQFVFHMFIDWIIFNSQYDMFIGLLETHPGVVSCTLRSHVEEWHLSHGLCVRLLPFHPWEEKEAGQKPKKHVAGGKPRTEFGASEIWLLFFLSIWPSINL